MQPAGLVVRDRRSDVAGNASGRSFCHKMAAPATDGCERNIPGQKHPLGFQREDSNRRDCPVGEAEEHLIRAEQ